MTRVRCLTRVLTGILMGICPFILARAWLKKKNYVYKSPLKRTWATIEVNIRGILEPKKSSGAKWDKRIKLMAICTPYPIKHATIIILSIFFFSFPSIFRVPNGSLVFHFVMQNASTSRH